jgi:hypothetical protein
MYASTPWAKGILSAALGSLTLAILGAILRRGERRASWIGFALCGWVYLTLSFGPWFADSIRPSLVTTDLLGWAYPLMVPEVRRPSAFDESERFFLVPNPALGEGLTLARLGSTVRRVDVWAVKGDGTRSLLAEDAQVVGLNNSGLTIQVRGREHASLIQAQSIPASFAVEVHEPSLFSGLLRNPPVGEGEFKFVGHALFALLFAWLGGHAGRFFYTPNQPSGTGDSGSASPDL